jgi:hypothetical protein
VFGHRDGRPVAEIAARTSTGCALLRILRTSRGLGLATAATSAAFFPQLEQRIPQREIL